MKMINLGAVANDGTGDPGRLAFEKANFNALIMQSRTGGLGRLKVALAGNSMTGYGALRTWGGYLGVACMLHHDADILIDTKGYYTNNGTDYPRYPTEMQGMNFAAASRDTVQMMNYQLPYILEAIAAGRMHPVIIVDPWQNDRFFDAGQADASMARVKEFVSTLRAHGITVILMDVYPQNSIGAGTMNAAGKHYVSHAMRNWCDTMDGVYFIPTLDILKEANAANEAAGLLNWVGVKGQIGGATNDEIHMACYGARLIAKRVADVLRLLVRAFKRPVFEAMDFKPDWNPYGNYFGAAGRLMGGGGKITNIADRQKPVSVVSPDVPAGLELLYDMSKGYQLTPSLTGDPEEPLNIALGGSPGPDDTWGLRITSNKALNPGCVMETYVEARWVNAENVSGIATGQGEIGLPDGSIIAPLGGAGSVGGIGHVMPSALSERMIIRSNPFAFRNEYGQLVRFDIASAVCAGRPLAGSLRVSRMGMFRTDNYL